MAEPHPRRGHGPDLDPVRGRPRGALRARGRVLSDRAPHVHPDAPAAAALVPRLCPERTAALARSPGRAVPPFRGGGGILGRHGCGGGGSPAPPPPRAAGLAPPAPP